MSNLALSRGSKLGKRVLQLGSKGRDVRELQKFLRLQGYDLGTENEYGYLTKHAVSLFQKEHGLIADGIAGKRFFALVLGEKVPIRRRLHVVGPQETLEGIAKSYGLGTEAFTNSKRLKGVFPGQKLLFFEREIWGITTQDEAPLVPVKLTGLIAEQVLDTQPVVIRAQELGEDDLAVQHDLIRSRRQRKKYAAELVASAKDSAGIYLPWHSLDPLNGIRYLKLLKLLHRRLTPAQMLWVELGPGVPSQRLFGGLNYGELNKIAARIVLSLPFLREPKSLAEHNMAEQLLEGLGPQIHSWKILLRVPLHAEQITIDAEKRETLKLPYSIALAKAFRHGGRLLQDEEGRPYYRYRSKGQEIQLHLPHFNALTRVLDLVNKRNLAGIILDQVGMEDPRMWQKLSAHFLIAEL